jgi:HEAT repeat protein
MKLAAVPALVAVRLVTFMAESSTARHLVYERLGRLGSVAIQPLERLLDHPVPEVRFYAASALLELGVRRAESLVLEQVRWESPYLCLATHALGKAKVNEVVPVAIAILRTAELSTEHWPEIQCLVATIEAFDEPIPNEIQERIGKVGPSWLHSQWVDQLDRGRQHDRTR